MNSEDTEAEREVRREQMRARRDAGEPQTGSMNEVFFDEILTRSARNADLLLNKDSEDSEAERREEARIEEIRARRDAGEPFCCRCGQLDVPLSPCSRCIARRPALYCSRECQTRDWKNHKTVCCKVIEEAPEQREEEGASGAEQTLILWHGTSEERSRLIKEQGFVESARGCLGPGVYCARVDKAIRFAQDSRRHGSDKLGLIKVRITFRNPKLVSGNDTQWQSEGVDACRTDSTTASRNAEWCVADPSQVEVLSVTTTNGGEEILADNSPPKRPLRVLFIEGFYNTNAYTDVLHERISGDGSNPDDELARSARNAWTNVDIERAACQGRTVQAMKAVAREYARRIVSGKYHAVVVVDLSCFALFDDFRLLFGAELQSFTASGGVVAFPTTEGLRLAPFLQSLFGMEWTRAGYYRTTWHPVEANIQRTIETFGADLDYSAKACCSLPNPYPNPNPNRNPTRPRLAHCGSQHMNNASRSPPVQEQNLMCL